MADTGRKLSDIVFSSGESEGTEFPVWLIVNGRGARKEFVAGFWLSRESAERYLKANRHNLGKKAYVYCASGFRSQDICGLYALAREEQSRLKREAFESRWNNG